jgi:hypothetical protein
VKDCQEKSLLFCNDPDFAESSNVLDGLERERANHNPSSSVVIPSRSVIIAEDVLYWVGFAFNDVGSVSHFVFPQRVEASSLPTPIR